jgi:hypothetical protein
VSSAGGRASGHQASRRSSRTERWPREKSRGATALLARRWRNAASRRRWRGTLGHRAWQPQTAMAVRGFRPQAVTRHSDTSGRNGTGGRRGFGHRDDAVRPTALTRSTRVSWQCGKHARDGQSRLTRPINTWCVAG